MVLYKDFDISFSRNELSGDIGTVQDEDAVGQSIKTLFLTNLYERPFQPSLGSSLVNSLFEQNDIITKTVLANSIKSLIQNFEPRAELKFVDFYDSVGPNGEQLDSNTVVIAIGFYVLNRPNLVSISIVLRRLR